MKILFVADGRSPIALNWIQYFVQTGHEVHLASTFPCQPELKLASLHIIPVAFSSAVGEAPTPSGGSGFLRKFTTPRLRTAVRQWLGPLTLTGAGRRLKNVIQALSPDFIHAMRIPYEGMIAALAKDKTQTPLIISIWGNDFTLHANSTPLMGRYTRLALRHANALHTDCYRDLHLAHQWGFDKDKPGITVPGNGGIDLDVFHPPPEGKPSASNPNEVFTIINPRGLRAYIRSDTFFKAIPHVLEKFPQTRFVCTAMAGDSNAAPYSNWLHTNNLGEAVELLPKVPRPHLAELFRQADLVVSPSEHDGTPNTLLEAMACGCLPIAGDIESLREWITPGENGFLFDPANPVALAKAIIQGLENADLRERAAKENARLIADRAEYQKSMADAAQFYENLIQARKAHPS